MHSSTTLMTKDTWFGVYSCSHCLQYRSEMTMQQNPARTSTTATRTTHIADGQLEQYLYAIVFALARRQMRQRWGSRPLGR